MGDCNVNFAFHNKVGLVIPQSNSASCAPLHLPYSEKRRAHCAVLRISAPQPLLRVIAGGKLNQRAA